MTPATHKQRVIDTLTGEVTEIRVRRTAIKNLPKRQKPPGKWHERLRKPAAPPEAAGEKVKK